MRRLRLPKGPWLWLAGAVALVVALNIAAIIESALRPEPSGRSGSAYATQPRGAAAWAELLERSGHPVRLLRDRPAGARLDPGTTVVVLEASDLDDEDRVAFGNFLVSGGRLVLAGEDPASWIHQLVRPPRWTFTGRRSVSPVAPVPETAGVRIVATSGAGGFVDTGAGDALPVLGSRPALMVVTTLGSGRAVLLADASPLENRLIGHADNAALALALAGPKGREVVFVESVHGFGRATGLAALPLAWRFALAGLGLAALLWLLARARRFGPAEDTGAAPAPARREHVEALALSLRRAKEPELALAPVREQARAQVIRRAGLAPGAADGEVREAALRLGYDDAEVATMAGDGDDDAALAAGRALAKGRR
ncbi:MAG: hypothetical protein QOG15_3268 [Solirubrobacteraceae bacterium]|jgi:hypothetical protein|nr:hypothetical protein [Solirubrobacteraceae bacterium]